MGFSERLKMCMHRKGLSNSDLARKLGVARQTVSLWTTKNVIPELKTIVALAEILEVTPGYLLFGERGMYNSVSDENTVAIPVLDIEGSCGPQEIAGHLATMVKLLVVTKEWILQRVRQANFKQLRIITARGDSMEPGIKSGDILIVDASKNTIEEDGIYAVQSEGNIFVKRIQMHLDGRLFFLSDNKKYEPMEVPRERIDTVTILGKCIITCNAREL